MAGKRLPNRRPLHRWRHLPLTLAVLAASVAQSVTAQAMTPAAPPTTAAETAGTTSASPPSAAVTPPPSGISDVPVEDASARGQFVRTTDSGAGRTATFSLAPQTYKGGTGTWQPIDNALRIDAEGIAHNNANRYVLDLPAMASGTFAFHAQQGGTVAWTVAGAPAASRTINGPTATYELSPDESLRVTATVNGLEDDLVLADAAAGPAVTYLLKVSPDLNVSAQPDGSIALNGADQTSLEIAPPRVVDGDLKPAPRSAVADNLTSAGESGQYELTVRIDPAWLADSRRVFPVVIDPTTTFGPAGGSSNDPFGCVVDQGLPTLSNCGPGSGNADYVGWCSTCDLNDMVRMPIQFPDITNRIPSDATVSSATLSATAWAPDNVPATIDVAPMTSSWGMGATWQSSGTNGNWTTAGGDFGATLSQATVPTARQYDPLSFSGAGLTGAVQSWINGSTPVTTGLMMKADNETYTADVVYLSQIQLSVTWSVPPNSPTDNLATAASSTSVSVTWTPPTQAGSAPLDHYTIVTYDRGTSTKGAADVWSCGTCTTVSVPALSTNTWFTMLVFAFNGDGAYSYGTTNDIETTYPGVGPGPATNVSANGNGPSGARVTWAAPSFSGSASIYQYVIVTYDGANGPPDPYVPNVVIKCNCTSGIVTGLSLGQNYWFQVFDWTTEGYTNAESNEITAGAYCNLTYGCNPGAALFNTDQAGNLLYTQYGARDGVYLSEYVFSRHWNYLNYGGNVRPVQLGFSHGEFVAVGTSIGWDYYGVLHTAPFFYVDGADCVYDPVACPYFNYTLNHSPKNNDWNTFQIQRHWDGSEYVYGIWDGPGWGANSGGGGTWGLMTHELDLLFSVGDTGGMADWGAEDAQGYPGTGDMSESYDFIFSHGYGAPSAHAPGITSYSPAWMSTLHMRADAGCTATFIEPPSPNDGGGASTTGGTC